MGHYISRWFCKGWIDMTCTAIFVYNTLILQWQTLYYICCYIACWGCNFVLDVICVAIYRYIYDTGSGVTRTGLYILLILHWHDWNSMHITPWFWNARVTTQWHIIWHAVSAMVRCHYMHCYIAQQLRPHRIGATVQWRGMCYNEDCIACSDCKDRVGPVSIKK